MERIVVDASKTYDVLIGGGLMARAGELMRGRGLCGTAAVIADDTTDALFSKELICSLRSAGIRAVKRVIPHGERSKSADEFMGILNFLADSGLTRADTVVALGGGVVGDISGFAAASFLRGVHLVQIPTTLLAAVDSSVGGKCAINLRAGKNLAGAFYQPDLVLCDTDAVSALPGHVFSDGMAEVIKYGAIASGGLLTKLAEGARGRLDEIIAECVSIKRAVVCGDEFDRGGRQILNFGHTPAHAIEKLSGFEISHGRAVAMGMAIMSRAAARCGRGTDAVARELTALLDKYSLPSECPFSAEELYGIALSDKKRAGDMISLVLPCGRGACEIITVPVEETLGFFKAGLEVGA